MLLLTIFLAHENELAQQLSIDYLLQILICLLFDSNIGGIEMLSQY